VPVSEGIWVCGAGLSSKSVAPNSGELLRNDDSAACWKTQTDLLFNSVDANGG
jgi:hypothetical protein